MKDLKTIDYIKYGFIAVAILELVGCAFEIDQLRHMTKPLLMPILLVYLRKGTTERITLSFLFAAGALIFSFIGDALLMFADHSQLFFLIGLGAFSITHVLYSFAFNKAVISDLDPRPLLTKVLYAVPFVVILVFVLSWVLPSVDFSMKFLIVMYTIVITAMVLSAIYRNGRSNQEGVNQVILGGVFFLMSDTLLALDMFVQSMANASVWIMLTYILAQWNIINGLQKHYNA